MINLTKYENMYDGFDISHNRDHLLAVRERAVELTRNHAPELEELAYITATLHDIGLVSGRDNHEARAVEIILSDSELKTYLGNDNLQLVMEAVNEHRASTGNPKSVLAKIISDADRIGNNSTSESFNRSYYYQVKEHPELSENEKLLGAAQHIYEKFGPNGSGARTYFPETAEMISKKVKPIIEALQKRDTKSLSLLLSSK